VPPGVAKKLDTVKAGLKAGTYAVWKGPIVDQDGKTVLKAGETADDKFLHGINFYVQGVQGKLPSGK
jgi:basic membrane protein A